MRRILLQWRGVTVWSYSAMLYAGLVAGVVAGNIAAHSVGIDAFRAFVATIALTMPALAGARMLYAASHWRLYSQHPSRIWNRSDGGAAMYGGFPVALLISIPLLAALHLSFGDFWDVATFTILVGMVFARFGCLMNGCCAGRPSRTWISMYLPNHRGVWERRIPTQCLEAAWAGVLLVAAIVIWHWMPFPGALLLVVTAGYSAGRLVLESTREPQRGKTSFPIDHAISAGLVIASVATLAHLRW